VELKTVLDDFVGIDVGGRGKLSIHPKLDVDEEEVAEISVGAIDDGKIRQCVEFKTMGGVCRSFISLVG